MYYVYYTVPYQCKRRTEQRSDSTNIGLKNVRLVQTSDWDKRQTGTNVVDWDKRRISTNVRPVQTSDGYI